MQISFESFLQRSGVNFDDTTLGKVLSELPSLTPEGPWLAGGALRRTILGEEPSSDFDFFFASQEQMDGFAKVIESGNDLGFGMDATKVKETEHHRTYLVTLAGERHTIQLIHFQFYSSAQSVIDSFDYTICALAFDGKDLVCHDMALWDMARKRLVLHKLTYPLSTMRRLLKYQQQGYFACNGTLTAILQETATRSDLQTQLDIAYID